MSDSFVTEATSGPTPPSGDIQWWNPNFRQGTAFTPTTDVQLLGARWWRIAYPSAIVDIELCVGPNIEFETATDTKMFSDVVVVDTGWTTMLFDTPIELTAGVEYCIWVSVASSENIDVARTASYFVGEEPSIEGLMETVDPSARFNNGSNGTEVPFTTVDAWYWLDPLVQEEPPIPPDPPVPPAQLTRNVAGCSPLGDDANPLTSTVPFDPACRDRGDC